MFKTMPIRLLATFVVFFTVLVALIVVPLVIPIAELETVPAASLATEDSQFTNLHGYSFHYRLEPAKPEKNMPSYVFLHGFVGNTFAWRKTISLFSEDSPKSNFLAYDRLGYGLSGRPLRGQKPQKNWRGVENPYTLAAQRDHVVELLAQLELPPPYVFIAHDTGAALALELADSLPVSHLSAIVLVAPVPTIRSNVPKTWQFLYSTPQLKRIGPVFMRQLGTGSGKQMLRSSFAAPDEITPEILAGYQQNTNVDDWDKAMWEMSRANTLSLNPRLQARAVPTLIINTEIDTLVPIEKSQALANILVSPIVTLENCDGHLPQEDCPDVLINTIKTWLMEENIITF